MLDLRPITDKRTAPGRWEVIADDEYVCVTMDGPDDYTPLGYPNEQNTADAAAIVAMDHTYEALLAVAEAARDIEGSGYIDTDGETGDECCHWCWASPDYTGRETREKHRGDCPFPALRDALAALDARIAEVTK